MAAYPDQHPLVVFRPNPLSIPEPQTSDSEYFSWHPSRTDDRTEAIYFAPGGQQLAFPFCLPPLSSQAAMDVRRVNGKKKKDGVKYDWSKDVRFLDAIDDPLGVDGICHESAAVFQSVKRITRDWLSSSSVKPASSSSHSSNISSPTVATRLPDGNHCTMSVAMVFFKQKGRKVDARRNYIEALARCLLGPDTAADQDGSSLLGDSPRDSLTHDIGLMAYVHELLQQPSNSPLMHSTGDDEAIPIDFDSPLGGASKDSFSSSSPSSVRITFASSSSLNDAPKTSSMHLPLHDFVISGSGDDVARTVKEASTALRGAFSKLLSIQEDAGPCLYAVVTVDIVPSGAALGKHLSIGLFESPLSYEKSPEIRNSLRPGEGELLVGQLGRLLTHLSVLHRSSHGLTYYMIDDSASQKSTIANVVDAILLTELLTHSDFVDCFVAVDSPFWVSAGNSMLSVTGTMHACVEKVQVLLKQLLDMVAKDVQLQLIENDLDDENPLWSSSACQAWHRALSLQCRGVERQLLDLAPVASQVAAAASSWPVMLDSPSPISKATESMVRSELAPSQGSDTSPQLPLALETAATHVAHTVEVSEPPIASKLRFSLSPARQEETIGTRESLSLVSFSSPLSGGPPNGGRQPIVLTPSPTPHLPGHALSDTNDRAPPVVPSTAANSPMSSPPLLFNDSFSPSPLRTTDRVVPVPHLPSPAQPNLQGDVFDTTDADREDVTVGTLTAPSSGVTLDDADDYNVGAASYPVSSPATSAPSSPQQPLPNNSGWEWERAKLSAMVKVLQQQNVDAEKKHATEVKNFEQKLQFERDLNVKLKREYSALQASSVAAALRIPAPVPPSSNSNITPPPQLTPNEIRSARREVKQQRSSVATPVVVVGSQQTSSSPTNLSFVAESSWGANSSVATSISCVTPKHLRQAFTSPGTLDIEAISKLQHAQALRRLMVQMDEERQLCDISRAFAKFCLVELARLREREKQQLIRIVRSSAAEWIHSTTSAAEKAMETKFDAMKRRADEWLSRLTTATVADFASVSPQAGENDSAVDTSIQLNETTDKPHDSNALCETPRAFRVPSGDSDLPTLETSSRRQAPTHRAHRLQLNTQTGVRCSECTQALVLSSRNLRGEQRRAAGEQLPNFKCDAIRKEAAQWRLQHLDEYKTFAAHQIYFLGDAHSGKSSLIACLVAGKSPMSLFKKAPTVVTPTLEITRSIIAAPVTRAQGSIVPVGGVKGIFHMIDALRWCRGDIGGKDVGGSSNGAGAALTARSAALQPSAAAAAVFLPLSLVDVPTALLRGSAPHALPSRAAVYVITFRLCDAEDVSRQSILLHAQHVLSVAVASTKQSGSNVSALPFVLIGTHADQVPALCDVKDLTAVQRVVGSYREWLESEFSSIREEGVVNPVVLDVFAISCSQWTILGERPKSAEDFVTLAAEWALYLALHSPNAPEHFLPTVSEIMDVLWETTGAATPFDNDIVVDGFDEASQRKWGTGKATLGRRRYSDDTISVLSDDTAATTNQKAPALVEMFWLRHGGGLSAGGPFSDLAPKPSAERVTTMTLEAQVARWIHGAVSGVVTLFTALRRYTEFTGHMLASKTLDNIILQHLQLAARQDEESALSSELLLARDLIVEHFLVQCSNRGLIARLAIDPWKSEVAALGFAWQEKVVSSLLLPYTLQAAASMPTSSLVVRQQYANQGNRHIVNLLQRAQGMGLDLTSGSMPVELAAYRRGHISRKLLFHLLPPPLNSVAASQRHSELLIAAAGLAHTVAAVVADDDTHVQQRSLVLSGCGAALFLSSQSQDHSQLSHVSSPHTSNLMEGHSSHITSSLAGPSAGEEGEWVPTSASSVFVPAVSSSVSSSVHSFLEDTFRLTGAATYFSGIQIEMPFVSLFYRVQSRIFVESATSRGASGDDWFFGFSARNAFVVTRGADMWLLLAPIGTPDSQLTFSEYRVVVVLHRLGDASIDEGNGDSVSLERRAADEMEYVCRAFAQEARFFVPEREAAVGVVEEMRELPRVVEAWEDTVARLSALKAATAVTASSFQSLRAMIERTATPSLRELVRITETVL